MRLKENSKEDRIITAVLTSTSGIDKSIRL